MSQKTAAQPRKTLRVKLTSIGVTALMVASGLVGISIQPTAIHAAACPTPTTDYGTVTSTISVATSGTFRAWSRIMAPDTTNNSYSLEIDGASCYVVGDATSIPANTWTWVDYQNGTSSSKIDATLSAGTHTVKMIGREPDVKLDRVIFASDNTCIPSGVGDNCTLDTTSPTTSITSPTTGTTVSSTTTISANAADDFGVTQVEFYQGTTLLCTAPTAPYTCSWNTASVANGSYALTTKAYDAAGHITTSTAVNVTVSNVLAGAGSVNDTNFVYFGTWLTSTGTPKYMGDDHYDATANDYYTLTFTGTQAAVYASKDVHTGIMAASVDGGAETLVDTYAPVRADQVLLYTTPTLANGTHTIKVRITGTKNASSSGTTIAADRIDITASAAVPGDVNGDGHVTIIDLSTVLTHYGTSGTRAQGDVTGDGSINIVDLSTVLTNYGK
jgi:hypothetical protein